MRDAITTIEAALAASPALASLVRERLGALLIEPDETSLVGATHAALAPSTEDPRLRPLIAAIVVALVARLSSAALSSPRVAAVPRRGLSLARRVWSRLA